MPGAAEWHQDQIDYWNTSGGERWVAAQEHTDIMLAPVSLALLERARPQPGMAVLDIGCGCGATTLALAQAVGADGRVTGVDVSRPMIEFAQSRLTGYPQVELIEADAAAAPFEPHFAGLAMSRFGVMFFGDPIAAFANLRKALKPGGRLIFACWRKLEENPWMQIPLDAAHSAGVPSKPSPGPDEPGPFSFSDPGRIRRILTCAGFSPPEILSADFSLDISAGRGLAAGVVQAAAIGPASSALRGQPAEMRAAAATAIEAALKPYVRGTAIQLSGGIWLVESEPS